MANDRTPDALAHSASKQVKDLWKKLAKKSGVALRAFARALHARDAGQFCGCTEDECKLASDWLSNKSANTSKPPQGIGSTRKKSGKKSVSAQEKLAAPRKSRHQLDD